MIYGSITNCTVVGHGTRSEWQCRLGYQIISENTATNTREIKLQLEARTIHSKYTAVGNQLTPTIDGVPLNTIGMNFSTSNVNVWQVLGTRTIAIVGAFNGIKTGSFTTNLTGDWGLKSGSASVTINLDNLHTPPQIKGIAIQEINNVLNNATDIVQFLSVKKYTFDITTFDDATISSYQIYHNNILIGSSTENGLTVDFDKVGTLATFEMDNKLFAMLKFLVIDSYKTSGVAEIPYEVTPYAKPNLVPTSSNIKRHGQLTGKVKLNLVGSFFNQSINNIANKITLKFTYWKKGETEPTTYYDIPFNATDNNIALYDWNVVKNGTEITDVNKDFAYYFKIRATDHFNKQSEMLLLCPVGEYLWAEFKDRVDFKNITIKGQNPFVYSYDETWIGTHNGKNLYRKVIDCGNLPNKGLKNVSHGIPNINYVRHIEGRADDGNGGGFDLPRTHTTSSLCVVLEYDKNNVVLYDQYDFSSYLGEATLEYTKANGYLIHGNSKQETTTGKNLFNKDNANVFDGYLSGSNVITGGSTKSIYISCKPNTTYTITKENTGGNNRFCVFTTDVTPKIGVTALNYVGTKSGADNNSHYTITTPSNANYLCAFIGVGSTTPSLEEILESIQIEEGSIATEYEKGTNGASPNPTYQQPIEVVNSVKIKVDNGAGEQQETTIDLKGNCVSKIDNVQDYLLICQNKYWLVKKVGKVVLNGSETNWGGSGKQFHYSNFASLFNVNINEQMISSHFKNSTIVWASNGKFGVAASGSLWVTLSDTMNDMTLSEFKTWLSNNNVTVYYLLATPQIIELGELPKAVKVFDGTNNVQLISNLDTSIEVTDNFNLDTYI